MKPVVSLQTTPVFPIFTANSRSVATVSSLVVIAFTISTSFMITGGLKKCSPANLSGRRVAAAISTIVRLEVLEQKIVAGGHTVSSSAKSFLFGRSPALDQPGQRTVDPLEPLIHERLIDLAHQRVEARLRADLSDSRTH